MTLARTLKIALGASTVIVGISLVMIVRFTWGPSVTGSILAVTWMALLVPALVCGSVVLTDGLSTRWSRIRTFRIVSNVSLVVSVLLCGAYFWILGTIAYGEYTAPSAELIFPDDFEGYFAVVIDSVIGPSRNTAGKNFTYEIPEIGILHVKNGWIAAGSWFEEGQSVPKRRSTFWRRRSGVGMKWAEFTVDWISTQPGVHGIVGRIGLRDSTITIDESRHYDAGLLRFADSVLASLSH